jgi:dihydrodipicolinate synthase/N-acetylneuraminate lyase
MARYRLKDSAGIIPALLAPFDRNGEYDPACPGESVDWLIGRDAGGFYPGPDFMVYSGTDEMMFSGRIMGADGANGSTCNVVPDLNIVAVDAFWRGDVRLAQKLMLAAQRHF